MENIETGFMLMGIGMTTVFTILLIVIYLGKGLIVLVNKYAPEEESRKQKSSNLQTVGEHSIPAATLAAIVSAVSASTQGKGKVIKVEKL